tara:strand:+ start:14153 stop:14827 length:675 start_codon:yes stop_codon:yes gene_type:complete
MKTIIVTGSGKGIGKETSIQAAKSGINVIAISRNTESLENIKNIIPLNIDITKKKSLNELVNLLKTKKIRIDGLINNAGCLIKKPFSNTDVEIFKKIYEVNVFGLAEITRLVIPFIHNYGHVVNISSMGGIQGSLKFSGLSAYSSSKGAVSILTEMLAEEYKETGPSFNCLAIGAVQTEMLENAFPGYKAKVSAKKFANYLLDFLLNGSKFYNGKVLQVSLSSP